MFINRIVWVFAAVIILRFESAFGLTYCVTNPMSDRPILADTRWGDLNCQQSISVSAARREYEPASVVIRSNVDVKNINVVASDLVGEFGSIDSSSIDIKYVKRWYQGSTAMVGIRQTGKERVLVPELLLNDDALVNINQKTERNYLYVTDNKGTGYVDISKPEVVEGSVQIRSDEFKIEDSVVLQPLDLVNNFNKQIWFTFSVPINTKAGLYKGNIKFTDANNVELANIPISLNVRPYDLEMPVLEYSLYYRGVLTSDNKSTISSDGKSEEQMRSELEDMMNHGVSNPTVYQDYRSLSAIENVFDLRKKLGMVTDNIYFLGMNTGNYGDISDLNRRYSYLKLIQNLANTKGMGTVFVYGIDEAESKDIEGQYHVWEEIHKLGGKIFVAAWRKDREKLLAGKVDMIVYGIKPNKAVNKIISNAGTKVYLYNRPQSGVENPNIYRSKYGISVWQQGFDGVMDYAYQTSHGFIWNDFDHKLFRDHVFAYPTSKGVVDTIEWEGFREAVDDVRYLSTLISFVNRQDLDYCLNNKRCSDAKKYIDELKSKDIQDFDRVREELDRYIKDLCCYKE